MQLTAIVIAAVVPLVACQSRECSDITNRFYCESTTYAQDGANIALRCGLTFLPEAENYAAACSRGHNGDFCFSLWADSNVTFTQAQTRCSSVSNSTSSCPTGCRNFLQSSVDDLGCCFETIFNERLSQLLLGLDVYVVLNTCNIDTQPPCHTTVSLAAPNDVDSCTYDEFWARIIESFCRIPVGQPLINALLENPACTRHARHIVNSCSRGTNNTYCLELFGTSFNLDNNPTRTAFRHTQLNNALSLCANYSSFQTMGCPSSCRDALIEAIDKVGCCINLFNDTINDIILPHFSGAVMTACGLESPGRCESDLSLSAGSIPVATWVYICLSLALLYGLS